MASSLSQIIVGTLMSIEGVACVAVAAETLTHLDRGALPTALWLLVDRCIPAGMLRGRTLASVELASPRQRACSLLHRRTLEQRANLVVGPMILRHRGL